MYKGRSRDDKAKLAHELTQAVTRVMGVKPETTVVLFYDFEKSDWAAAGKLADS